MTRSILLAAALALAIPAFAAAQTTSTGKPAATAREKAKKTGPAAKGADAKKSPAAKSGAAGAAKGSASKPAAAAVDPALCASVLRARSTFRYAADACTDGRDRCNRELLDDSEKRFVDECRSVTSSEKCDAERIALRESKQTNAAELCKP